MLRPGRLRRFFLSPTNLPYVQMVPDDLVQVTLDGQCHGRCQPSSELPFHLEIMRQRRDTTAVIHTHSTHATTIACLRREIPAIHYLVGLFGGNNIRCADYATFGTPELWANLLRALTGRRAALMSNHGLVVLGSDLRQALSLTLEAETLATLYWRALCAGEPTILSDAEMAIVMEKSAPLATARRERNKSLPAIQTWIGRAGCGFRGGLPELNLQFCSLVGACLQAIP